MVFAVVEDELLDGGVAEGDGRPAEEEGHDPPGEEVGGDEEGTG